MVAQTPFDQFHRYSNNIIRKAVFGVGEDGKVKNRLKFDANQFVSMQFLYKPCFRANVYRKIVN